VPPDPWTQERRRQLGDRIRELRLWHNLTQEAFAERSGVDRRTLQRIERGTSDPTFTRLLLIARALSTPIEDLVRE
jgi:transcriptional regulator with XRE-family HTH domain